MSLADILTACIGLLVPTSLAFISFRVRGRYGERLSVSLSNLRALTDLQRDVPWAVSGDDVAWAHQEVGAELRRLQAPRFRPVDTWMLIAILSLLCAFGWSMFFALNVVFSVTGWGGETFWPINIGLCVLSVASFGLWLIFAFLSGQGKATQKDASVPGSDDAEGTYEGEQP